MKKIFILLFVFAIFSMQAKVSFFAVNLSEEMQDCVLRNENEKIQPWGVENWKKEEVILLDNNLPCGEYFIWTKDNDKWCNTQQSVLLEDEKIYCLEVLPGKIFKLKEFSIVNGNKDTALFGVINHSGHELQNVKFSTNFDSKTVNYFNITDYENCFFPVKKGKWKVFWEYDNFPKDYFALQIKSEHENKNIVRTVTVENSNIYLLILLPERADFMRLGLSTFPYK